MVFLRHLLHYKSSHVPCKRESLSMQHISLLALPSCLTTSISLPLEILNAANELARIRSRMQAPLSIDIISKNV
jgi:hypothetical protein